MVLALDHADAATAAKALVELDGRAYRPFNLAIADSRDAFWLRNLGEKVVDCWPLPPGISLITAHDRNDPESVRIRTHLPRFERTSLPDPERGRWQSWEALLSNREFDAEAGPESAMAIVGEGGFGTVSSALIALPSPRQTEVRPRFRFANGRPDETPFEDVAI